MLCSVSKLHRYKNNHGPNTDPCETPHRVTASQSVMCLFNTTLILGFPKVRIYSQNISSKNCHYFKSRCTLASPLHDLCLSSTAHTCTAILKLICKNFYSTVKIIQHRASVDGHFKARDMFKKNTNIHFTE